MDLFLELLLDLSEWVSYLGADLSPQNGFTYLWRALQFHNLLPGSHSSHKGTSVCENGCWIVVGGQYKQGRVMWPFYWCHSSSSLLKVAKVHTDFYAKMPQSELFIFHMAHPWRSQVFSAMQSRLHLHWAHPSGDFAAFRNSEGSCSFHSLVNSAASLREVWLRGLLEWEDPELQALDHFCSVRCFPIRQGELPELQWVHPLINTVSEA